MDARALAPRAPRASRSAAAGALLAAAAIALSAPSDARAAEATAHAVRAGDDALPPLPAPDDGGDDGDAATANPPESAASASRYAALDRARCTAELRRRHVPFVAVAEARGVVAPVRLAGPLSGVSFHSVLPPKQRATSPIEIYDCRLVLALDDFARILARHDVVEVVHMSVYRPPSRRARLRGPGRRHTGALAIDAGLFRTKSGETISVDKDFHGRIGQKTCGDRAVPLEKLPERAATLRRIVCEAAEAQLFNVILTPDYNRKHHNHFHLEVTAGVKWMFVR